MLDQLRAPLLLLILAAALQGCSSGYAPVYDQSLGISSPRKVKLGPDEYQVRPGDTLIAIAFRFGVDYRDLARVNNLRDSDLIYAGQVLKTKVAPEPKPKAVAPERSKKQVVTKTETKTAKPVAQSAVTKIHWRWPHDGRLLARFSSSEGGNKGLDISGKIGDPVRASADGKVVYAGSGLLGYGNLVIISHNQEFLSAYAHNSRILVTENQSVKSGQTIAELGNTGAAVPMLHFEIRRDGRPVDPLKYLSR